MRPTSDPSNQRFYVHDHLYSPSALVDSSGNVVERYEYDFSMDSGECCGSH